jgi:peptide/nickel transport system permease protein
VLNTIGRRLLYLVPVLFVVSFGTSLLLELVPGDPVAAALGDGGTPESYAAARTELGLDRPVVERYFDWLGKAVTGDFGRSLINPGIEVRDLITQALPITLELALLAGLMAFVVAVPLGVAAAQQEGSRFDRANGAIAAALISVPPFLAALILIFLFVFHEDIPRYGFLTVGLAVVARQLWVSVAAARRPRGTLPRGRLVVAAVVLAVAVGVFLAWPSFGRVGFDRLTSEAGLRENLRSAFLPALTLALVEVAVLSRLLRTDMTAVLQEDYISAARAKGMPMRRVLYRDALRPASFSLVTLAGVSLGRLIGGTVIVEQVFAIQGMGRTIVGNITAHDYPVVQAGVLVIATAYVVINALVDISYALLDPRIRRGRV